MDNRIERYFANDAYDEVEDSDREGGESSEDDVDILLHGTMKEIKRIQRWKQGKESSSDEDEFEKEMRSELDKTMKNIEGSCHSSGETSTVQAAAASKEPSFYDNSYFDSDSDEDGTSEEKKKRKHQIPTNDELFYDPDMDDNDQKWVDQQRRMYQPKCATSTGSQQPGKFSNKPRPLPLSDAVLNCPGCMSLLCLDCQRHATYSHQYRAMFVTNCAPDMSEVLHYVSPTQPKHKKTKKRKHHETNEEQELDSTANVTEPMDSAAGANELYHPVRCDLCKTEVAVYDKDEVYHFFNVLASY